MVGNGLGPEWFPSFIRKWLTDLALLFFKEAAWEIHDASYEAGEPARHICDRGFLSAMLRDASETTTTPKMFVCTTFGWFLWLIVRIFGWTTYNRK